MYLSDDLFDSLQFLAQSHSPHGLHVHGEQEVLSHSQFVVVIGGQLSDVASVANKPPPHLRHRDTVDQNFSLEVVRE